MIPGNWQLLSATSVFAKVEGVKFETSFMSEQASLFLSSIGLLGEYCPTSRKKNRHSFTKVGCMHLEPFLDYITHSPGCSYMQPFPFARNSSNFGKEIIGKGFTLITFC